MQASKLEDLFQVVSEVKTTAMFMSLNCYTLNNASHLKLHSNKLSFRHHQQVSAC